MRRTIRYSGGALLGGLALLALAMPTALAFGDLDERRVVPAGQLPAVGLLTGNGGRCTGFLAGSDRVIVTAAHCVVKRSDGTVSQDAFEFQPGYRDGTSAGIFRAHVIANGDFHYVTGDAAVAQTASQDWAILLTERPTGVAPLELDATLAITQLTNKPLSTAGYGVDIKNGRFLVEDPACRVIRTEEMRIDHSCRGSSGSSGGPIFLRNEDGSRGPVVGVIDSEAISTTSERLVITAIRQFNELHTLPDVDLGGHAAFIGAFLNATKVMAATR